MTEKTTPKKAARKKAVKKAATKKDAAKEPAAGRKGKDPVVMLIVAVLVILFALAALIYVPKYNERRALQDSMYNNYQFKQWEGDLWSVNIEVNGVPYTVLMHYHPKELETIKMSQESVDLINALATKVATTGKGQLYITMNPDAPAGLAIAGVELAKVLGEKFGIYDIPTRASFSRPKENYSTEIVPVKTCEDAVDDTFVIYIREHESDFIGIPDGYPQCIVLQGTDANETIKVADRFVYGLFNILPAS